MSTLDLLNSLNVYIDAALPSTIERSPYEHLGSDDQPSFVLQSILDHMVCIFSCLK